MPDPNPSFYNNDSTPTGGTVINSGNPIALGSITKGSTYQPSAGSQFPVHVWNDKNGGTANTMQNVKVGVKDSSGGDTGQFISGTALNGNKPFFQAKSNGSSGCPDDAQAVFTPVGGAQYLAVGDIPANARRSIWIQAAIPGDATSGAGILNGTFVVEYTFDS